MYSVYIGDTKITEETQLSSANKIAKNSAKGEVNAEFEGNITVRDGMNNIIREYERRTHSGKARRGSKNMYMVSILSEAYPTRMMRHNKTLVLASSSNEAAKKAKLYHIDCKYGAIKEMKTHLVDKAAKECDKLTIIP